MAATPESTSMALFCDFENVALGVRDARYEKFDIKKVLERLLLKGSIVVKKAYCDWDRYREFKAQMHEANFELIEIPHVRQSGKNSADIRMVVDALDLCYTKSHVDTFVIISGDSDFSPLVSKLRENAKIVIGVGVKGSTSDLLTANCDEFIFYDDLVRAHEARRRRARQQVADGRDAAREPARDASKDKAPARPAAREPARDAQAGRDAAKEPPMRGTARSGRREATADGATEPTPPIATADTERVAAGDGVVAGGEPADGSVATAGGDAGTGAPSAGARRGTRRAPRRAAAADAPASADATPIATEEASGTGDAQPAPGRHAADADASDTGLPVTQVDPDDDAIPDAFFDDDEPIDVGRPYRSRQHDADQPLHADRGDTDSDADRDDAAAADAGLPPADNRPPESVRRQEAIDLVVETVEALITERGADDKIWGSMVKQTLKRRRPGFAESYYGYRSFNELLEDARKRNLLALDHDEKSGGYVIRLL